ncbi:MAG: tRNA preQ1(34) S-adenosylmethionine ribosyltransferase-isomerase QueA [Pirellulales bacterium]
MSDLKDYDYTLPRKLIAQHPLAHRADARLMVIRRDDATIEHHYVRDLPAILRADDCLVVNNTKVLPARLVGRRTATGGHWEGLFLEADDQGCWKVLSKSRGKIQPGETVTLVRYAGQDDAELTLVQPLGGGRWVARPRCANPTIDLLRQFGRVPLPHYIRGGSMVPDDRERYQTVFARHDGSVAAPTAGLHFTDGLLEALADGGISIADVTLHVGLDTFRPITTDRLEDHQMHSECGEIAATAVVRIQNARAAGGRLVAVGTTSVRVLETASRSGELDSWSGNTELFIKPPYKFQAIDALMTNFHMPCTTLLVLVCCFGGHKLIMDAYDEAVQEAYRFYSYGDAMLIL